MEAPYELRRHPDAARLTWLAAFVHLRVRTLTDDLVDLLIETIHTIGARAERKVERELLEDLERVTGKQDLLFALAEATLAEPDGVVRGLWREAVVEQDAAGRDRVNRITYEIAVLEALRERLRCKEIWVVGADRYRNPDEDLPADFERNRQRHYQALELPLDAERFVTDLHAEMHDALSTLDAGLTENPAVRLSTKKDRSWITLTPFEAQPDPPNLAALEAELNATWPMTSLLDMVKETDLRLGFTEVLKSPTAYETLERAVLQPRLLLCLHGMGTNAGLQRMASLDSGTTAKDLAYVRRRYLNVEAMRRAIAIIADGTLRVRNPVIWGDGTTACASDSKHFGAWDQNLTTQWHARYGGRGVMIYLSRPASTRSFCSWD